MDARRRQRPVDPEFDRPSGPDVRLRDFDPIEYQRLVVNPFLAVLGLVALAGLTDLLLRSAFPPLAVAAIVPTAMMPYLVQYHCLDCGETGRYWARGRHACAGALARAGRDGRRRDWFPPGWLQLVIWSWVLGSAALLLAFHAWG